MPVVRQYKDVGIRDKVRILSGPFAGRIGIVTERIALRGKRSILTKKVRVRFVEQRMEIKGRYFSTKNIEVIEYAHRRRRKRNQQI